MIDGFEKFLWAMSSLVAFVLFVSCNTASIERLPSALAHEITLTGTHGPVLFSIEIADTAHERARGLSGREVLPETHGMLFIFDASGHHSFWMKNTQISLDLIFFDDDLHVVGVLENAQPLSLARLQIDRTSRFVLEVLAGSAKKYGINIHSKARLSYD